MKRTQELIGVSFTNREMQAIADMLLGNGIDVDPIINDLYPDLNEDQKGIFRCKIALMLKGKLPKFNEYVGFHRSSSSRILKVRVYGESSLLGLLYVEILEVYKRNEKGDSWYIDEKDYAVGTLERNSGYNVYDSIEEAAANY